MEWISHDDRTLKEHLIGLKEVIDSILPEKEQTFFSIEELKEKVYALIAYHDLAKTSVYFQLYLSNSLLINGKRHKYYSTEELRDFIRKHETFFKKWQENPELKRHALLGAWMSMFLWNYQISYTLDDFLFLKILESHHGYLKNFNLATTNPKDYIESLFEIADTIALETYSSMSKGLGLPFKFGNIEKLLNGFKVVKFDMQLVEGLRSNQSSSHYFKTLFLYSLLLSADKGDMMVKERSLSRSTLKSAVIDQFKKENILTTHAINSLREKAYQIAVLRVQKYGKGNFFSITLPTGLGKTLIAYKTALQIKERYCPDFKIVYCLPFTSIIDQNALIFKRILESSGIDTEHIGIHHHLSVPDIKEGEDDSIYSNWEYLTEGWQNEITITTFVQLWESIFACHNKQLRKFHNLVNSVIILDEIQSINPKLFHAFEFIMESMAHYFNTKFLFVTATQPILLEDKVTELCFKESNDYFFRLMNRTVIDTTLLGTKSMGEEELAEIIIDNYEKKKQSTLVICNTIRYSQNLVNHLTHIFSEKDLHYLSAAIIPYSREKVLEEEIKKHLFRKEPVILISTQVVEAGVDIDFDIVYRDFAPLSSISQAAGRCNRNSEKSTSKVILFRSGKEKIYDPTQLNITENVLKFFNREIFENQFYELNRRFFEGVKSKIQDDSGLSNELIKDMLTLSFEKIGTESRYRLLKEEYKAYNYFIPINYEAEKLWEKYLQKLSIEEHFQRKRAIKLIMPQLMQYVVRIPDYVMKPEEDEKDMAIIKRDDWKIFYDKKFGYKLSDQVNRVEIL